MYNLILEKKLSILYSIYLVLFLLLTISFNCIILTDSFFYETYSNELSTGQITKLLHIRNNYQYFSYLFLIIIQIFKFTITCFILNVCALLYGLRLNLSRLIKVVLLSEGLFLFPIIIKIVWFYFFQTDYKLSDIQLFYPISILNILTIENIDKIWIYPLQLLNVFELLYWIALAYGISKLINNNFDKALKIVLSSYVPALVVWVVFVMFLTVTLNPG